MANHGLPDPVALEDLHDVVDFLEAQGRTVHRERWVPEIARRRFEESIRYAEIHLEGVI